MKKILLTLVMAFAAMNINAQLVVDSIGRVGVGTDAPKSLLSVGTDGDEDAAIECDIHGKTYGIKISNIFSNSNTTYGSYFRLRNLSGDCFGGRSVAVGENNMESYQNVIGISGEAGRAPTAIGVLGRKSVYPSSYVNFAGIYGSDGIANPSFTVGSYNYSDIYAGYFKGKVRVTNGIYATVLSPSASPSPSGQNGTTILSERGESVTDKLSQVQALQYLRYDQIQETNTTRAGLSDLDLDNITQEELDSLMEALEDEEPERYLSPIQYGLDANQLKAVYPELVYEDNNGNVSINYVEMVPLLVQCINELKNEIAELKGTSPKKAKAQPTAIEESVSDIDMVRMDQNKPNPFSESTVISLNIPQETQTANIYIYDMNGKQVQSLPVGERGETNITVYASDLAAGMYIYTLVVDGKVSVTRRMIVEGK
ncbi:MAG: T9SS type A sorting domain-containing protein [Bacteroidaceae bacterium]|nr:T9SS type A sorting domain-containing protein [Bacteroidaceae bacterium]